LSPDPVVVVGGVPVSWAARFAVTSVVFGVLGVAQVALRRIIKERFFGNELQDFVDLCSLANVSVLVLSAKQHGHYIHGR
jgi:meckelin